MCIYIYICSLFLYTHPLVVFPSVGGTSCSSIYIEYSTISVPDAQYFISLSGFNAIYVSLYVWCALLRIIKPLL
jgi:hypothetical protein